jgi:hypothetical protein
VYTLAIGKDGKGSDAYSEENQFIADRMAEAESVSARKATLLNPTEDDETVHVLRRRLFERIDEAAAERVIEEYRALWHSHRDALASEATKAETLNGFRDSYPLHPDVMETFTNKMATLANFQRVRGMLRILGRSVSRLWELKPPDATAIHLHHIDPGYEPVRQEFVTRLGQSMYVPAIRSDIAGEQGKRGLAQELDDEFYHALPPYTTYVARTAFMHSLAFNDQLKGLSPEHLRYSLIGPAVDISFVDAARQRFLANSAYLDDRPGVPMRFLTEANLTQVIRRAEQNTDPGETRAQLNDRIKSIFGGTALEPVPFPGGPWDVPDEIGNGRPLLVVPSYEGCTVGVSVDAAPDLIARIYERKGAEGGSLRQLRNNLVFIVADDSRVDEMRHKMVRRLALRDLKLPDRLAELAEHQQAKVRELEGRSEAEVAIAIQQCFRHLFYPSRNRFPGAAVDLAHSALEIYSASERPGAGQQQIVRSLRELHKLRTPEDEPDAPTYVRDRTPLKRGQITTAALRDEFRRDAALPMLLGDDVFIKGIRKGVENGEYVYQRGGLLFGPDDPITAVNIDEQAVVFTMAYARDHGIWPRAKPEPPEHPPEKLEPPRELQPPDNPDTFTAEGLLKEALIRLWEQARARRVEEIGSLSIHMFDATDAFRLLGVVAAVRAADRKQAKFEVSYETTNGSTMEVVFTGAPTDAQPVKDFLEPQLRAAKEKNMQARFELSFTEGLPLSGDAVEKLTDQLTRFATGSAYVEATAGAKA